MSKIKIVISVYGGVVKGGEPRSLRSFQEPEIDVDYIERVIKGEE